MRRLWAATEARALVHTYSRAKALRVAAGAPALLEQVRTMLAELERRNAPAESS